MSSKKPAAIVARIDARISLIRSQRVMLSTHLADLYGVGGMAWQSSVMRELCASLLAVALLLCGAAKAEAAYRLVFRNGTSVEVREYEDLGDSVRYPRFNGTVTVPKANVLSIEELPAPAPNQPPLGANPQLPLAAPFNQGRSSQPVETPPPPAVRSAPALKPVPLVPIDFTGGARSILGSFAIMMLLVAAGLFFFIRILPVILGKKDDKSGLPYKKEPSLLFAAERSFYGVLCQALDHQYTIFAKVRLGDLLSLPRRTPKFWLYRNRINRKHVDFVLCDSTTFSPVLVIELDGSSHEREDRKERDVFVDGALEAAGLPILHMPAQHAYAPAELRVQINERLGTGHAGNGESGRTHRSVGYL